MFKAVPDRHTEKVERDKRAYRKKTTYLAIDVRVYGSNEFHVHPEIEHPVLPQVKELFSALFDSKTSLQEWEDVQ